MDSLSEFLKHHEVDKGEVFSHTSKIKPCRRYYIEGENLDTFYRLYNS